LQADRQPAISRFRKMAGTVPTQPQLIRIQLRFAVRQPPQLGNAHQMFILQIENDTGILPNGYAGRNRTAG